MTDQLQKELKANGNKFDCYLAERWAEILYKAEFPKTPIHESWTIPKAFQLWQNYTRVMDFEMVVKESIGHDAFGDISLRQDGRKQPIILTPEMVHCEKEPEKIKEDDGNWNYQARWDAWKKAQSKQLFKWEPCESQIKGYFTNYKGKIGERSYIEATTSFKFKDYLLTFFDDGSNRLFFMDKEIVKDCTPHQLNQLTGCDWTDNAVTKVTG